MPTRSSERPPRTKAPTKRRSPLPRSPSTRLPAGYPGDLLGIPDREHLTVAILGCDAVGQALWKRYDEVSVVLPIDPVAGYVSGDTGPVDQLHVCLPYAAGWMETVVQHVRRHPPRLLYVHATVIPGTTRALAHEVRHLGETAVAHTPVLGTAPTYDTDLGYFLKVLGSVDACYDEVLAMGLHLAGLEVAGFDCAESTEWGMILSVLREIVDRSICRQLMRHVDDVHLAAPQVLGAWNDVMTEGCLKSLRLGLIRPYIAPGMRGLHMRDYELVLSLLGEVSFHHLRPLSDLIATTIFEELDDEAHPPQEETSP